MNSIKCAKCGFVFFANAPSCKRCGEAVSIDDAAMSDRPERREQRQMNAYQVGSYDRVDNQNQSGMLSRLPFITMGIGILLLFAGRTLGLLAWPLALVLFLTGSVTSVITLVARKRSGNRLWPPVTALVVNSALLITFGVVVPAIAVRSLVSGGKSPEWREYVSSNGGFTVQMPDEPEVTLEHLNSEAGPVPMHSVFARLKNSSSCTTMYFDYSKYELAISADEFLEGAIQRFVIKEDAVLLEKKPIELDGNKGFEFEMKPNSGGSSKRSTTRMYWVPEKKFVYVNHVMGLTSSELYRQRSTFLDSFRFVSRQELNDITSRNFGRSPLLDAIYSRDMARVNSLLQQGASDIDKERAISIAAYNDMVEVVQALINAETNLKGVDERGRTPLMLAAIRGHRSVRLLIQAGADLNAQDRSNGWTALMWSIKEGQSTSASELITAGTNLNLRDRRGKTALMHAAVFGYRPGHILVVQQLLTAGADPNIEDEDGQTALEVAERISQLNPTTQVQAEVVRMLRNASE